MGRRRFKLRSLCLRGRTSSSKFTTHIWCSRTESNCILRLTRPVHRHQCFRSEFWWSRWDSNRTQAVLQTDSFSVAGTILQTELVFCSAMLPLHHDSIIWWRPRESNPSRQLPCKGNPQPTAAPIILGLGHRLRTCTFLAPNEVDFLLSQSEIKSSLLRTLGSNQSNH